LPFRRASSFSGLPVAAIHLLFVPAESTATSRTWSFPEPAGIHALTAVCRGPGQLDGAASPIVYEVVDASCYSA
jgi:hypothetical protein